MRKRGTKRRGKAVQGPPTVDPSLPEEWRLKSTILYGLAIVVTVCLSLLDGYYLLPNSQFGNFAERLLEPTYLAHSKGTSGMFERSIGRDVTLGLLTLSGFGFLTISWMRIYVLGERAPKKRKS